MQRIDEERGGVFNALRTLVSFWIGCFRKQILVHDTGTGRGGEQGISKTITGFGHSLRTRIFRRWLCTVWDRIRRRTWTHTARWRRAATSPASRPRGGCTVWRRNSTTGPWNRRPSTSSNTSATSAGRTGRWSSSTRTSSPPVDAKRETDQTPPQTFRDSGAGHVTTATKTRRKRRMSRDGPWKYPTSNRSADSTICTRDEPASLDRYLRKGEINFEWFNLVVVNLSSCLSLYTVWYE